MILYIINWGTKIQYFYELCQLSLLYFRLFLQKRKSCAGKGPKIALQMLLIPALRYPPDSEDAIRSWFRRCNALPPDSEDAIPSWFRVTFTFWESLREKSYKSIQILQIILVSASLCQWHLSINLISRLFQKTFPIKSCYKHICEICKGL